MANRERFMDKTSGGWVVSCRICPKREGHRVFDSARQCHDFWRLHADTQLHQRRRAIHHEEKQKLESILKLIQ